MTSASSAPDLPPVPGGMHEYKALEVRLSGGGAWKASEEKLQDGAAPHAGPLGWLRGSAQA